MSVVLRGSRFYEFSRVTPIMSWHDHEQVDNNDSVTRGGDLATPISRERKCCQHFATSVIRYDHSGINAFPGQWSYRLYQYLYSFLTFVQ